MAEALKRRGDWDADRHRGMTRWGHREETGVSKPSREASEETNLWTPWPQTSSLQDCKSEFLSFNPSAPWYFVTAAHAECYAENHLAALTDGLRCPTWRLSSASLNVPGDVSVNWSPRVTLSFYTSKKGVIFGEPCRLHSAGARKPPNTNLRGRAPGPSVQGLPKAYLHIESPEVTTCWLLLASQAGFSWLHLMPWGFWPSVAPGQ